MRIDPEKNNRILLIDDNHAIHEEIRRILIAASDIADSLVEEEVSSPKGKRKISDVPIFKIDSAYQGQEGLALVERSLQENKPYALAFVDVHMPPGWDGIEATCEIWKRYPELQIIIITAYTEYSWEELLKKLGYSERMVILKKPFDSIEVLQMAVAMTKRWQSALRAKLRLQNLEKLADAGSVLLRSADENLAEITEQLSQARESANAEAIATPLSDKIRGVFGDPQRGLSDAKTEK
jgi:CheY-like chemotaxis protein